MLEEQTKLFTAEFPGALGGEPYGRLRLVFITTTLTLWNKVPVHPDQYKCQKQADEPATIRADNYHFEILNYFLLGGFTMSWVFIDGLIIQYENQNYLFRVQYIFEHRDITARATLEGWTL